MRIFTLALALALPLSLTACADSAEEEMMEEGAPMGDQEDVIGDGEIIDEAGEPDANVLGDGLDETMDDMEAGAEEMEADADAVLDGDADGDGM